MVELADDAAVRACRQIKRILFVLARYPLFTRRYIRDHIDKPDTKPDELADYESHCVHTKLFLAALLMSVYVWNSAKNFYLVYLWLNSFNYSDHQSNLKELAYGDLELAQMDYKWGGETLTRVSCLITNCSRLAPAEAEAEPTATGERQHRLLADVSLLPLFMLCNPHMDALYYTPVLRLDSIGVFAFLVTIYTHFLLGCWPTIQQMLLPAHDDMIMFISSPQVSQRVVLRRCRDLLHDVACSYKNFCLSLLASTATPSAAGAPSLARPSAHRDEPGDTWRPASRQSTARAGASDWSRDQLARVPRLLDSINTSPSCGAASPEERSTSSASSCLPIVFTQWWRARLARILLNTFRLCLLAIANIGIACLLFVQWRIHLQAERLRVFDGEMRRRNCFIWREQARKLDAQEAFRLADVQLHWTFFALVNAAGLSALAGLTILAMFSSLWIELLSINLWVAEMRAFLVASLLATRPQYEQDLRRVAHWDTMSAQRAFPSHRSRFKEERVADVRRFYHMDNLREHFEQSINVLLVVLYRRVPALAASREGERGQSFGWRMLNSKGVDRDHETRFQAQMLALNSIEQLENKIDLPFVHHLEWQLNYDIETLEQIYVNFRLLVEYIHRHSMVTSLVVVVSYLLNYGYLLLAVICRRKIATPYLATNSIVCFAITISSAMIFLCAAFHSNAKQLQPLLYSLIAHLTHSKNLRVQHMRSLWIRQALMLDTEGGLALSTYGLRITYVYIIQLLIGTATVVVLALKPHV